MTITESAPAPSPGSVEFFRQRADGIGASEVAALFGLSPFGGRIALYLNKTTPPEQLAAEQFETVGQRRGHRLEDYLADEAAYRFGWRLERVGQQRHPDHPYLTATPDRLVLDDAGEAVALLEIKTARNRAGWADPQEQPDGVPDHYALQVQAQLAVGVEWEGRRVYPRLAYLVASVGSLDDFRCYRIEAHDAVQARIIEAAGEFWSNHVAPRVPPPFDGSPEGSALLRVLYPRDEQPDLLQADSLLSGLATALRAARLVADEADRGKIELEQRIKALIGDRAGAQGAGWRITWKAAKPGSKIDWPNALQAMQAALAAEAGVTEAAAITREIVTAHTASTPGSRRFLATFDE